MSLTRRTFIGVGGALPFAAPLAKAKTPDPVKRVENPIEKAAKKPIPQIPPLEPHSGPPALQAGPMLGHVSHSEARIWLQMTQAVTGQVELCVDKFFLKDVIAKPFQAKAEDGFNVQVHFDGLEPNRRYEYRVRLGERELTVGSLQTFAPPSQLGKLRFAFSSCVGRLPSDAAAAFGEMAERANFDFLLMLGDNHYGDTTDLERQRLYYTAYRKLSGYRDLGAKRPIYAIWDDHDFGPNDSDSTSEGKEQSLKAFREYWVNPPRAEAQEDPAIYYKFERAGVEFFMLDVRWHRTPNKTPDGPDKTMLGKTQLEWLKRSLQASKAKIKILASGSEWQTYGHRDSWTSFATERAQLWDWLEAEKIQGVIFLSGDRHFSAGYHLRSRWPEFTAGPLGSPNERNAKAVVTPESFTLRYDGKMWMVLDIDTTETPARVSYEIWEAGEGLIESATLPEKAVLSEPTQWVKSDRVQEILQLQKGL